MRLPLKQAGLVMLLCALVVGCGADHWHDKALASERIASERVGGFSDDDKRLYHQGLQHIINSHQRLGSFMIGQVIDQERARDAHRADARQHQAEQVEKAKQHRLDKKATANLKSSLKLANSIGAQMYRGGLIEDDYCSVRVDGDYFENASNQDKSIIKQTIVTMCSGSYTELGGNDARRLPDGGLHIRAYNLADDIVYSDLVSRGADAPAARVQKKKTANTDPRSAYTVLQHWDIPCSDKGGFGEKVMASSHRQADLELVYKRWMAEQNPDKTQCVSFMAYASQQSFQAAEHPSQYTNAQLDAIPAGLTYTNNPNTGYEGWSIGGEHEHILHMGSSE
jgi:hypothetical protein